MKLKGANLLELSLSIAFALVVFAITLQLIQESTDRVNKSYQFQQFQHNAFKTLHRIHQVSQWNWGNNINILPSMNTSLYNGSIISKTSFAYTNSQWIESPNSNDAMQIQIEHPDFNKKNTVFITNVASISNLKGCLSSIKIALDHYYQINQVYPPHQQLNYLTQSNILNELPNNPYTIEDYSQSSNNNLTDWHYSNINGTITLFAYTHPHISINF